MKRGRATKAQVLDELRRMLEELDLSNEQVADAALELLDCLPERRALRDDKVRRARSLN